MLYRAPLQFPCRHLVAPFRYRCAGFFEDSLQMHGQLPIPIAPSSIATENRSTSKREF
jgi:hypothetical protein